MYRMFTVLPILALIGCGTPSSVQVNDRQIDKGLVIEHAWFGYASPEEVARMQGRLLMNFQLMEAMKELNAAQTEDAKKAATEKVEAINAAMATLVPPQPKMVKLSVTNWIEVTDVEVRIFHAGTGKEYKRVVVPAKDSTSVDGAVATAELVEGKRYRLEYYSKAGAMIGRDDDFAQIPAYEGISAFVALK